MLKRIWRRESVPLLEKMIARGVTKTVSRLLVPTRCKCVQADSCQGSWASGKAQNVILMAQKQKAPSIMNKCGIKLLRVITTRSCLLDLFW